MILFLGQKKKVNWFPFKSLICGLRLSMKIATLSPPVPNPSSHRESIYGASSSTKLNHECWLDNRKLNCSWVVGLSLDSGDGCKVEITVSSVSTPTALLPVIWFPHTTVPSWAPNILVVSLHSAWWIHIVPSGDERVWFYKDVSFQLGTKGIPYVLHSNWATLPSQHCKVTGMRA